MRHSHHVGEDTSGGVFGYRATMDADASAVGDVEDFGEELFELGRVRFVQGVRAFGDQEVAVLEGKDRDGSIVHWDRHCTGDGFAINGGSCQ